MIKKKFKFFLKKLFILFCIIIPICFLLIIFMPTFYFINFFILLLSIIFNYHNSKIKIYTFIEFIPHQTIFSQIINFLILSNRLAFMSIYKILYFKSVKNELLKKKNLSNYFFFFFFNFFKKIIILIIFKIPSILQPWVWNFLKSNENFTLNSIFMDLLKHFYHTTDFAFEPRIFINNKKILLNGTKDNFFLTGRTACFFTKNTKIPVWKHFININNNQTVYNLMLNSIMSKTYLLQSFDNQQTIQNSFTVNTRQNVLTYFSLVKPTIFEQAVKIENFKKNFILSKKAYTYIEKNTIYAIENNLLMPLTKSNNSEIFTYVGFPKDNLF